MIAPRTIVITGASSGIGRALALHYARRDRATVRLVLLGRDGTRLDAVAGLCRLAGSDAKTLRLDVRDRAAMHEGLRAIDRETPVDLLVANAGIATGLPAGALAEDPDAVRAITAINWLGALNTVEPLIDPMISRGSGRIALTGSIAALRGLPYSPAYCATKAAVHLYADSLRGNLRKKGVGVSLIVPGFVHTPLNENLVAMKPLALSDTKAARIVADGLDAGRAVIAFPLALYWAARLSTFLPARLADAILSRFAVDMQVTRERATPDAPSSATPNAPSGAPS